jgi:photosystem II stability/assembly factor-like uncharacterized protein
MKRITLIVLFIITLWAGNASGEAWEDVTGGLSDREFYSIAKSSPKGSEVIYIGASGGLYERKPGSQDWKRIFTCRGRHGGINDIYVAEDNTIYIATKNGLYASANSGKTWKQVFRGMGKENYSTHVTLDPGNRRIIYLGTLKGLFRTEDKGNAWRKSSGILGSAKITSIAPAEIKGEKRLFVIANNEIYKVSENFEGYKKVFGSGSLGNIEDKPDEANNIIESENNTENNPIFLLNDITAKNGDLYVSTNRGLFISTDRGASWARFNTAGLSDRSINSIFVADINSHESPEKILAATGSGVFEYDEKETLWKRIYRGMDSRDVRKLIKNRSEVVWALCRKNVYKAKFEYTGTEHKGLSSPDRILSNFDNEPTINETIDMAIGYAEVSPDKIKKWRRGASYKALFPKVNFGLDYGKSDTYEIYTSSTRSYWTYGPEDKTEGWDLNFSWDLSDLVWNPSQTTIDIRSKLMVQLRDDIVDEITRTYFERRRLQVESLMYPPESVPLLLKKKLRMQELTAFLDGLTGSRFSRSITQND